jgi:hypothetical protein
LKTVKVLVAALAAIAIATPAMAITADISGNLWIRGIMAEGLTANEQSNKGFDQRLRIFTTAAANENVKMVLGLEVDGVWGRVSQNRPAPTVITDSNGDTVTIPSALPGKEFGSVGADATALLEMKHLYLDTKIPALGGATLRAGLQGFNVGRGMIINDDATGMVFKMPVAGNSLELTYIRPQAGGTAVSSDASDFYAAKYSLKFGDISVAPYVGFLNEGSALRDGEVLYAGLDVDGKAGNFGYAFTGIWNDWDFGAASGNGMALFGKVTTKVDAIGLSLEAGYMGDDDAGDFVSLSQRGVGAVNAAANGPIVNISEISTGGRYTTNTGVTANLFGADYLYRTNWMFVKVGADMKFSDALKGSIFVAHIEEAEDRGPAANQKARTWGQEVNAYLDYAIVPNLDLNLMGAYLFADEDVRADDIWKVGTMLAYRF